MVWYVWIERRLFLQREQIKKNVALKIRAEAESNVFDRKQNTTSGMTNVNPLCAAITLKRMSGRKKKINKIVHYAFDAKYFFVIYRQESFILLWQRPGSLKSHVPATRDGNSKSRLHPGIFHLNYQPVKALAIFSYIMFFLPFTAFSPSGNMIFVEFTKESLI